MTSEAMSMLGFSEGLTIKKVEIFRKSKKVVVFLKSDKVLTLTQIENLDRALSKIYKSINVLLNLKYENITSLTSGNINDVLPLLMYNMKKKLPVYYNIINEAVFTLVEDSIEIFLKNRCSYILKMKKVDMFIGEFIFELIGESFKINFQDSDESREDTLKYMDSQFENYAKKIPVYKSESKPKQDANNANQKQGSKQEDVKINSNIILGNKQITELPIGVNEIQEETLVILEGEICKAPEVRELKNEKFLIISAITDYKNSILFKFFTKDSTIADRLIVGSNIKLRGQARYDTFAKDITVMAANIVESPKKKEVRQDNSEKKRVELHLHTQMSSMDGVTACKELVKRAATWGHSAIAITDHGVLQAYPEAMDAAKKNNIKVIYGVEAYIMEDVIDIVKNPRNQTLEDEYVVFDLETTGLTRTKDKIIEIGAVKIRNSEIVDRFSKFIQPEIALPEKIIELTGINDDMLKNAETIEKVLPEFLKFLGDSVLVAHNAGFDTGFIKYNAKKILNIEIHNTVLDTLELSRNMLTHLKKHKLDVVAKDLGVSLENHHRAVDDAEATAYIFLKFVEMLNLRGISTLDKVNKLAEANKEIRKKQDTYHAVILVKDLVGLKNLYKLVSKSNLEYFYKRPRMPKGLINELREGLIIGSACEAGELYKAILNKQDEEEIEDIAKFYDYLEIQPLGNNAFMLKEGLVESVEEIKDINRKIIDLGEKLKKPVVATCDVHFIDPKDEVYRRILMASKGFKDADDQAPLYLRTTEEMIKEFDYLGEEKAFEVVITNTNKISDMVENIKPIPDGTYPPFIEGAEEQIKTMTMDKAYEIYGDPLPEIVEKRLDKELKSIIGNGYSVLYLIAQKLVSKSVENGYLVGSRGSVGSSVVAFFSGITEVNALAPHYVCPNCKHSEWFTDGSVGSGADLKDKNCPKCGENMTKDGHEIPFEVFLGFEGDKEPDIDLNFSGEYQQKIHKYTEELFGTGYVFKAGTIGTVADKTAYGFVKKYLEERNISVHQPEIERLSVGCTGVKRTTGQHPGGLMICPKSKEIYDFTPIQHPADDPNSDIVTTHFDYHSISGRILKLDLLGHDDPTIIRMLQDLTGVNPKSIPLGDEKVLSLFTTTKALGITPEDIGTTVGSLGLPEFGTKFVRQMLVDTKPTTFAELVRISGLSHGTDVWLNNAQDLIREGTTTLKSAISTRDDIMNQLMLYGVEPKHSFKIMESVRKGKGLKEEDEKAMREENVPEWFILSCKKIKYMFPKAHACAYVMMAIRIAYFKVYYPKAYYATYFTVRGEDFEADTVFKGHETVKSRIKELGSLGNNISVKEKGVLTVLEMVNEMFCRNIKFLHLDLYESEAGKYKVEEDGIRPPFISVPGLGLSVAESIVEARMEETFISKEDLKARTKVSTATLELLDKHGCLNDLDDTSQISLF